MKSGTYHKDFFRDGMRSILEGVVYIDTCPSWCSS